MCDGFNMMIQHTKQRVEVVLFRDVRLGPRQRLNDAISPVVIIQRQCIVMVCEQHLRSKVRHNPIILSLFFDVNLTAPPLWLSGASYAWHKGQPHCPCRDWFTFV